MTIGGSNRTSPVYVLNRDYKLPCKHHMCMSCKHGRLGERGRLNLARAESWCGPQLVCKDDCEKINSGNFSKFIIDKRFVQDLKY